MPKIKIQDPKQLTYTLALEQIALRGLELLPETSIAFTVRADETKGQKGMNQAQFKPIIFFCTKINDRAASWNLNFKNAISQKSLADIILEISLDELMGMQCRPKLIPGALIGYGLGHAVKISISKVDFLNVEITIGESYYSSNIFDESIVNLFFKLNPKLD